MLNPTNADTAHWLRQRDLFEAACALQPGDQADFINEQAADSPELAASLLRMLVAHARFSGHTDQAHIQLLDQVDGIKIAAERGSAMDTGTQIGAFRLLHEIGRGGMGVVWKASRVDDVAQTVAIKFLPPHRWDLASRARFQAERDALAGLEHPGIARLIDAGSCHIVGQSEDSPFYVMEYVEGISIIDYANGHNLSTHERVRLFTQVLDAVDYAHRQLLIHRDLKPSNILVNAAGQVKLIDFGIAKNLSDAKQTAQTGTQQRFFSPTFAAPEQLRGLANSNAVDVYQLGAVLYELLSAKPLFDFQDASASEVERSILERVPAAPSRVSARPRSGIDADLDAICLHCLRKEPALRYASVAALHEDLRRTLAHRGISIRQGQAWYRVGKFLQRNTLSVGLASTVLVLVIGFSWTSWQQSKQIARERDVAVVERKNAQEASEFLLSSFRSLDAFGGGEGPKTISEYLRNCILRLRIESRFQTPQRLSLMLALAQAASTNPEAATELKLLITQLRQMAEQNKDQSLRAEIILLQAAIAASPFEARPLLEQLQGLKLDDPRLQLRVQLGIIRTQADNWLFEKDIAKPLAELQLIEEKNSSLWKDSPELLGQFLATFSVLLDSNKNTQQSVNEYEGLLRRFSRAMGSTSLVEAQIRQNLSNQYRLLNQYPKAFANLARAQIIHTDVLGEEHEQTEMDLNALAKIFAANNQIEQSIHTFNLAIAHAERFGEARYAAIAALSFEKGSVCAANNQSSCADSAMRRAIEVGAKIWRDDNPNMGVFRMAYGKSIYQKDANAAFQQFALARRALPHYLSLQLFHAVELARAGDSKGAAAQISASCQSRDPSTVLSAQSLALIAELKRTLGAVACFEQP